MIIDVAIRAEFDAALYRTHTQIPALAERLQRVQDLMDTGEANEFPMTKLETSHDTLRNGIWSREVWPKFSPWKLDIPCSILDIRSFPVLGPFSDGLYLGYGIVHYADFYDFRNGSAKPSRRPVCPILELLHESVLSLYRGPGTRHCSRP